MADDVENHTLRLLQEMRAEMREGFARMDARLTNVEQRLSAVEGTLGKIIDAVTEIAKVQEKHSGLLGELVESDRIAGSRLNAVEARLGRIEKQMGFTHA